MNDPIKPEGLLLACLNLSSMIRLLEFLREGILRKRVVSAIDRLRLEFDASHPLGIDKQSWDRYEKSHSPFELLELFVKLRSGEISAADFTREITQHHSPRILNTGYAPLQPLKDRCANAACLK